MSVFDPNQDYSNERSETNPENLYETVLQVQQLLQDITSLLEPPEDDEAFRMRQVNLQSRQSPAYGADPQEKVETNQPLEEYEPDIPKAYIEEEDPIEHTIYDNIFQ
jgi:hypothetical protein